MSSQKDGIDKDEKAFFNIVKPYGKRKRQLNKSDE